MDLQIIEGLPSAQNDTDTLHLRVLGESAVLRCARFIASVSLVNAKIEWLVERTPIRIPESTLKLTRSVRVFESVLWTNGQIVAELLSTECGGIKVSARNASFGAQIWERFIPVPEAAEWAEASPAWPGAQTEEIDGFFADDLDHLVVCVARHSRTARHFSSSIRVDSVPPFACQLDSVRLDLCTGNPLWSSVFSGIYVGILERKAFTGIWASRKRLGIIDLEIGSNNILHEFPHSTGWPVIDGSDIAVPWHSKDQVGVDWISVRSTRMRCATWPQKQVMQTQLHRTDAGLAVQTNDQGLTWLGNEDRPKWTVRAKPYIYRVFRGTGSDVFVATDGNGGRLLAFDAESGKETLNLKPALGGVGISVRVPGHAVLASVFRKSRSYSVSPQLMILSMLDRQFSMIQECLNLVGEWEHGVICQIGRNGDRIAIVDVRS